MARKRELTYFTPRRRWKKKIQGKVHYFGERCAKSDDAGYRAAMGEYRQLLDKLAKQPEQDRLDAIKADHAELHDKVQQAKHALAQGADHRDVFLTQLEVVQSEAWKHPDFQIDTSTATLTDHVNQFLKLYRTQAKLGHRSINRADMLRIHLNRLLTWTPNGTPTATMQASAINADLVENYYHHLADLLAAGTLAPGTVSPAWAVFKQFVRWLWQRDACQLPKNLDSKLLRFTVPAQDIATWDTGHIARVLTAATPRTQLYILLALNCGMTAKDISDLEPEQVNWSAGTITRKRSKTKDHAGVPTVTYKLWPQTLDLLKAHRATTGNRVLMSEQGSPLVTQRFNDSGNLARVDCVRLALRRTLIKINNQAKRKAEKAGTAPPAKIEGNFSAFRATSATMLAHQFDEAIADYWLGHAPRGIGQRHYMAPNQGRLDQAVVWLGQQYEQSTAST